MSLRRNKELALGQEIRGRRKDLFYYYLKKRGRAHLARKKKKIGYVIDTGGTGMGK